MIFCCFVFLNMTHLTPVFFGEDVSQSMIGIQMGFAYISVMVSPILFSLLSQYTGMAVFPYCLFALYVLMLISTVLLFRKKQNCSEK